MTDADKAAAARERTCRAVAKLLGGSGLHVRELAHELVITNPHDSDKGQVYVAYADGYVSWERVVWSYWGTLDGVEEEGAGMISGERIVEALGADVNDMATEGMSKQTSGKVV